MLVVLGLILFRNIEATRFMGANLPLRRFIPSDLFPSYSLSVSVTWHRKRGDFRKK